MRTRNAPKEKKRDHFAPNVGVNTVVQDPKGGEDSTGLTTVTKADNQNSGVQEVV